MNLSLSEKKEWVNSLCNLCDDGNFQNVVLHCNTIDKQTREKLVNIPSTTMKLRETPIHYASYAGHIDIVKYLLEIKADPYTMLSDIESTPLHSAAAGGQKQIILLLLGFTSNKKKIPINKQTKTGWTALHSALAREYLDIAKILVNHGARLDIPNNSGITCRKVYEDLLLKEYNILKEKQEEKNNNPYIITMNGISIQIASDLHLEFYDDNPIDYSSIIIPSAPILALLGDIGIPSDNYHYRDFLLNMADQFEKVLVIAGNHEYYNCKKYKISFDDVKQQIISICNLHPKLIFMDKTSLLINGVRILGCTLWSYIPDNAKLICQSSLNDYKLILVRNNDGKLIQLTADISSSWYGDEISWLQKEVSNSKEQGENSIIVLSHHTPSFFGTSAPIYTTHPWKSEPNEDEGDLRRWINCCFSSDLDDFFINSNIKVWAYGHTHYNNSQIINNTQLISNQRGYLNNINKDYSPRCCFYVNS